MHAGNPPLASEMGDWIEVLLPAQEALWWTFVEANMSDWPGNSFEEIKQIAVSWQIGVCTELIHTAIACWIHHNTRGERIPAWLADWAREWQQARNQEQETDHDHHTGTS